MVEKLRIALNEAEMFEILSECGEQEWDCRSTKEVEIELLNRPRAVVLNKRAIYNMTNLEIPEDILIGLSFGHKFLFPFACTKNNLCEILSQLDLAIEQAVPELKQLETTIDICRVLHKQSKIENDRSKCWLSFIQLRIKQFFFENKDFFATKTDKGGHVVILNLQQYRDRIEKLLNDDSYQLVSSNPLKSLVETETNFVKKLEKDPHCHSVCKGLPLYEPNTL